MKTPDPTKAESSAPNRSDFTSAFPKRQGTVAAEVLSRLVDGERLTSLDAVYNAHTTRLAAVIHYLERDYGWNISRSDFAAATVDGRVTEVREYFLSGELVEKAAQAGAREFSLNVKEARAKQRAASASAKTEAGRRNASRSFVGLGELLAGGGWAGSV